MGRGRQLWCLTLDQLGVPPVVAELIARPRGLFLLTGLKGSGKSTTLTSLVYHLRQKDHRHTVDVKDLPEPISSSAGVNPQPRDQYKVIVTNSSGTLQRAFPEGNGHLLIGELKDSQTVQAAISAVDAGHMVFGVLDTRDVYSTLRRLNDLFPADEQEQIRAQLSTTLIGILSQTLLPRKPKGLIAAFEMLVINPSTANLICLDKLYRIGSVIQTSKKYGMQLLDDALFRLWATGLCEEHNCIERAILPAGLQSKMLLAKQGLLEVDDEDEDKEE